MINTIIDSTLNCFKSIYKLTSFNNHKTSYQFNYFLETINLCNKNKEYPKLIKSYDTEFFTIYMFKSPYGITVDDFIKNAAKFSFFLNIDASDLRIEKKNYYISLKVLTNTPAGEYDPEEFKQSKFKIPIGYSINNNKTIYYDLISASNAHCYIAGSSGGGKSIMLRLILSHLVNSLSKRDIELSIINTKRVDLKDFEHCKHTVNYMTGSEGVESFLKKEIKEMDKRYKLIEKNDSDDLSELRAKGKKIPYRLIVVEEISSYKGNKDYQRYIEILASQGRGAGMLLMLVTQLPSKDILPNTVKCNINTILGLKTNDKIRSSIIAGEGSGLETLRGKGHCKIFNGDYRGEEIQGLYISKETMKEIINKNKRADVAGTTSTHDNKNQPK